MVTGLLCAGLALALALLVALHLRLAGIPAAVWSAMRRERAEATPRTLDAMKEAVAARVATAVIALRQYEDNMRAILRRCVVKRTLLLVLALAGCNADQPICLDVAADSTWAKAAGALTGTPPSSVVCPGDRIYTQSVDSHHDAGTCDLGAGDGTCIVCLKEHCCTEAADEAALVSCGFTLCPADCRRSP